MKHGITYLSNSRFPSEMANTVQIMNMCHAMAEYGFKVIISTSFADIFRNNCMQNGLITVQLSSEDVDRIMTNSIKMDAYKITVDLENQKVFDDFGFEETFDFDQFRKDSILEGLDDIGITLQFDEEIEKFERNTLK